jgi:DNA-directed RNA polymerase subunit RPC12/RpoP
LSVADETAALPICPPTGPYYFLVDENEQVVCHVDPIDRTRHSDIGASGIIQDPSLRLVDITEVITERKESQNEREVPVEGGSKSVRSNNLTECVDCGAQISKSAAACPHCGRPRGKVNSLSSTARCPTCNSSDIEKISASDKVGSALLFGVFSIGQISKTFRCKNCGYKW